MDEDGLLAAELELDGAAAQVTQQRGVVLHGHILLAAEAAAQVGAGDDTAINRDSICRLVCDMIDEMDDGTGWVRTSRVGDQLIKRYPDFDVRNFGSKSLNKFLASFPVLEVE